MNTLRFLLLLISIFFFAYLFQTKAIQRIGKREEVLSDNVSLSTTVTSTPSPMPKKEPQNIFLQYHYPNSKLQFQGESSETIVSGDGLGKIVAWYARRLHAAYPQDGKFVGKKDKALVFMGTDKINKITVQIKQNLNSPVILIIISITAS